MQDRRVHLSRVEPRLSPRLLAQRHAETRERLSVLSQRAEGGLRKTVERNRLTYDPRAERLAAATARLLERKRAQFEALGPKLAPNALRTEVRHARSLLAPLSARLLSSITQSLTDRRASLTQSDKLLVSLSYRSVLARGYAVVKDENGQLVHARAGLTPGDAVSIEFADGAADALIAGGAPPKRKLREKGEDPGQQTLF